MSNKRSALMIIGTLMALETCLILGQVSHNSLYLKKKSSWRMHVVRVEINEETAYIQARSSMARVMEINGRACKAQGKATMGLKKRFILTMHENCEESISSTPRIRNLRKPSRTRVRSWKHQLLLLCPVKLWQRIVGVVHPRSFRQDLRVFLKNAELEAKHQKTKVELCSAAIL